MRLALPLLAASLLLSACGPAAGGPITDTAGLERALEAARGGEVLLLEDGDYADLSLRKVGWDRPVIVRARHPGRAVLARLNLQDVRNIAFEGVTFRLTLRPGEQADRTYGLMVAGSDGFRLSDAAVVGSDEKDLNNNGIGLFSRGNRNVTVERTRFHYLYRGAMFWGTTDLRFVDNEVTRLRSDGAIFAGVDHVAIERNLFSDFTPSMDKGDHPDFIQFWTRHTGPSSNVVIRGNVLTERGGGYSQGMLIGADGPEQQPNFLVENNFYVGTALHGITVVNLEGALIRNNTVLNALNAPMQASIRVIGGSGVVVERNIVCGYSEASGARTIVRDNILLACRDRDRGRRPAELFGRPVDASFGPDAAVTAKAPGAGFLGQSAIAARRPPER